MKKFILFVISFVTFFQITYAQRFSLGCKGGMDYVNIRFDPVMENWGITDRLSYDFGLIASYRPGKLFKIHFESGFIEKGGQLKFKKVNERWLFKYGYFSNQLVFILNPIRQLNLETGIEQGHTLYAKRVDIPGQTIGYGLSEFKKNDYSAIIGLGFNFLKNFTIDLRYVYGFTPLKNCFVFADPVYSYEIYNKHISIGLRYYFLNIK